MPTFRAIVIDKTDTGQTARLTDFDDKDLMEGDVTFRPEWSTVNYKDGLAVTGKAPVVRRFPMIAGIDFAGTIEQSAHPAQLGFHIQKCAQQVRRGQSGCELGSRVEIATLTGRPAHGIGFMKRRNAHDVDQAAGRVVVGGCVVGSRARQSVVFAS